MSSHKLFIFVLIVCLSAIRTSADISLAKTLHSQDIYNNTEVYFDHESQQNGMLLYMFCHRSPRNMSCTIFREEHYVDKLPRISPCNVTFKVERPYSRIGKTVRVLPLNPSKAFILWVGIGNYGTGPFGFGEATNLMYTIVDFNTCRTTETTLKILSERGLTASANGLVPLFYPGGEIVAGSAGFAFYEDNWVISYHDLRCGVGFCKRKIDKYTGEVTPEADYWYTDGPDAVDIVPKNPHDPYGGNFFFDSKDGVIYKYTEGTGLVKFPTSEYHVGWEKFRYSVREYLITVCKEIEGRKVKCDQVDYDGNFTMRVIFDLTKRNVGPVPFTLRGGGFLLLTTECVSNCTEGAATNYVYRVNADGKMRELTEIKGLNCKVDEYTHWHKFFEAEEGNLCVSLLCYSSNLPEELYFQCLNVSNF